MKWTKEMLDAVKGNELPHGRLKAKCSPVWTWIEEAASEGAGIEWYRGERGWRVCQPVWDGSQTYRVAADWQPKPEAESPPFVLQRYWSGDNGKVYRVTEYYDEQGRLTNKTAIQTVPGTP
jgi:hypothetical protein